MSKVLIRSGVGMNPESCEVLSTDEATFVALEQIRMLAIDVDNAEELVVSFADILELMRLVLKNKNIDPVNLFSAIEQLKAVQGTFDQKIAIQEQ